MNVSTHLQKILVTQRWVSKCLDKEHEATREAIERLSDPRYSHYLMELTLATIHGCARALDGATNPRLGEAIDGQIRLQVDAAHYINRLCRHVEEHAPARELTEQARDLVQKLILSKRADDWRQERQAVKDFQRSQFSGEEER